MKIRNWQTALGLTAMLAGCGTGGGTGEPAPGPGSVEEPGEWPGGSIGEWASGEGVEESWHREPGAGGGGDGARGAPEGAAYADGDVAEGGGAEPGPAPPPGEPGAPVDNNQAGGLEGGEIDDNDDFAGFLDYAEEALERFADDPMVRWLDVSTRHLITVRDDDGNTVPDATVQILGGQDLVAWGRTRADGRFAFFPGAYGAEGDFRVIASAGGHHGEADLGEEDLLVTLDGLRPRHERFQVDVAFIIDETGSMGEEIARIKQTVSDIAGRVGQSDFEPDLRFGMVGYRDFGDAFVTHTVNFTDDVEAYQQAVDGLEANGGGDGPEALNQALEEGLRHLEWRRDATLRLAFIVADAPAHHYEQATYTYDHAMLDAATMGVKLFPIASGGSDGVAELQFRQLAQFTLAHFIFITEGGGSSHGSGGSDYEVDPAQFDVEKLDDLVVRLVTEEMEAWHAGVNPPR